MKKAAVLWTGGKDSFLALLIARNAGYEIVRLVTFVPADSSEDFKAHPRSEMRSQAQQLGFDIEFLEIKEPYRDSYISGLTLLRERLGISAVITGDIDLVDEQPNWIEECCRGLDLEVIKPLWHKDRNWILDQILSSGIKARISWINDTRLPAHWLHQVIDAKLLQEMKIASMELGFDLAGENGEYHTMVMDSPAFIYGRDDRITATSASFFTDAQP